MSVRVDMHISKLVGAVFGALLFASCAHATQWSVQNRPAVAAAEAKAQVPVATSRHSVRPAGDEAACYAALQTAGVHFERVEASRAAGVAWAIELIGPIDGVRIHGGKQNAPTNYLDCRLALALLDWAPDLRAAGVAGLHHYSMYRRDATVAASNKPSGHAHGRAIDVALFELTDGRKLSVLNDWTKRARGVDPCESSPVAGSAHQIMRDLVCAASARELFQMVLTPHYNEAHRNHVHLEIDPGRDGAWIG